MTIQRIDTVSARRIPKNLTVRIENSVSKWFGRIMLILTAIFTIGPGVLVVLLSFSTSDYIAFPPTDFGFKQYEEFFSSNIWMPALRLSLVIAFATTVLTMLIAIPAVVAIQRTRMPGRQILLSLGVSSLLIPVSAYAVALYGLYSSINLLGNKLGIVIAHSLLAIPLVLLIAGSALARIPRELDLVAMTLGASRVRAIFGITLRLLTPAIFTTGILAFLTSFDEAVLVNFLGGAGLITLPKAIFDSVRYGIDPAITAIAGTLILLSGLLLLVRVIIERKEKR